MNHAFTTISLAAVLAACSQADTPETDEPTGMNAGVTESVDMDYTRISFAPGAVSAQVPGTLTGFDDENEFVIDVAAGQVMTVKKVGDDANMISLWIKSPLGEDMMDRSLGCNGEARVDITTSGDHAILVSQCMKADEWNGDYMLDVEVK